jgi:hypothetical protein
MRLPAASEPYAAEEIEPRGVRQAAVPGISSGVSARQSRDDAACAHLAYRGPAELRDEQVDVGVGYGVYGSIQAGACCGAAIAAITLGGASCDRSQTPPAERVA